MSHAAAGDARVLLLLFTLLPGMRRPEEAPLGAAEWRRIGGRLRDAGINRQAELLAAGPAFWERCGLEPEDETRLRCLLERAPALDAELKRLEGRGISALTRADAGYPARLRRRLGGMAPPVLFGAGRWDLLTRAGLAVVGSRGVDDDGAAFTREVARRCAADGLMVVTGGAKGVDRIAMAAALEAGGAVLGVMPGDLERAAGKSDVRPWLGDEELLLLSPFHPQVGFTVGNAMSRNKLIYALAEYGLVVASAHGQGGTWEGAREVQRHGWVPLFVRNGAGVPDGNRELLRPAARPFPALEALGPEPLPAWLARHATATAAPVAGDLFPQIWPHLAAVLSAPRGVIELAEQFHLQPEQAQAWLHRAEAEGKVERVSGPVPRFCLRAAANQQRQDEPASAEG